MRYIFLLVIIMAIACFSSCSSDNTEISCGTAPISFAAEVKPIIDSKCATNTGCHASGSTNGPGALTSYAQISAAKNQISSAINNGRMPKNGSLSSNQKNTIICWIQSGAPNN